MVRPRYNLFRTRPQSSITSSSLQFWYVEFKKIRRSMLLHLKCQRTTARWVYVPHIT